MAPHLVDDYRQIKLASAFGGRERTNHEGEEMSNGDSVKLGFDALLSYAQIGTNKKPLTDVNGNPISEAAAWERLCVKLFAFAKSKYKCADEDANELVQKALVEAGKFKKEKGASLRTYLIGVMENKHLAQVRKSNRDPESLGENAESCFAIDDLISRTTKRQETVLAECLNELEKSHPDYRLILQLRFLETDNENKQASVMWSEIAAMLNVEMSKAIRMGKQAQDELAKLVLARTPEFLTVQDILDAETDFGANND